MKSRANERGVATSRSEWEWRIGQDAPDVGRLAETPALAMAATAIKDRLEPVFVTDIRRTTRLLHLDDNTVVEAAIDEGSIEAGAACEPVSELELELKGGRIGPVYRLAADLQALGPLWISPESKAARGWHLRTGQTEGAQLAQMPKLRRLVQAAAGFHDILGGTLGHLMANIGPTLRGDPEALHQMRIAIRESRAALQLFEQHLDAAAAGRFNAGLRRFGEIFGAARDWDVFCLETLPAAMPDLSAERLEDLNVVAEVDRQLAHAAVADAVHGTTSRRWCWAWPSGRRRERRSPRRLATSGWANASGPSRRHCWIVPPVRRSSVAGTPAGFRWRSGMACGNRSRNSALMSNPLPDCTALAQWRITASGARRWKKSLVWSTTRW